MLDDLFRRIESSMPGFTPRPQQRAMSQFIADSLRRAAGSKVAIVEAPTGVGKTLGYLAGAIHTALADKKLLIISTATVNLQQQLIRKDLPAFVDCLPEPVKFVQIKGRRRYLCPSKLIQHADTPEQHVLELSVEERYTQQMRRQQARSLLEVWQSNAWDGDRDHYNDNINPQLWQEISTDSEGCIGKQCSQFVSCPYYRLRREMQEAQIVVVNHDLVLSDADLGGGLVLPNPEEAIFVFDEAHKLPQKALDHAAKALNFIQLYQTVELADSVLKKIPETLAMRQHDFGFMLMELRRDLPAVLSLLQQLETLLLSEPLVQSLIKGEVSEPRIFWDSPLTQAMLTPCTGLYQHASTLYKHYSLFAKWVKEAVENRQLNNRAAERVLPQIGTVQNTFGYLIDFLNLFLDDDQPDRPPNVRWIARTVTQKQETLVVHAGPMSAAGFLERNLWSRAYGVVMTSATLRGMGLFRRFRADAGLKGFDQQHFLAVASPFDYANQAVLALPAMQTLPNIQPELWQREVASILATIIDLKTATLVLFTAKSTMDEVYGKLPPDMRQYILLQGDQRSARDMVAEHIRRVELGQGSIIFGMDSFAEGVDLPGNLCTHVIITKLPFPVFTRPIEQARQEWIIKQGGQPFVSLSLPAVSIRLIQACGRLLRKETDSGRITILDRRLLTKAYGKQLLEHLPDYRLDLH